ncbi:MAG: M48 family metallopeptidase [Pseudomonadota bacterium]
MATKSDAALRQELLKVLLYAALALFLIPALTYGFVRYANHDRDTAFLRMVEDKAHADKAATSAEKQDFISFYRKRPPSTICSNREPEAQEYRTDVCEPYGDVWQFYTMQRAALWTLVGGVVLLVAIGALGGLAFINRKWQHASFVIGWRLMTLASAAEVVLQGVMGVWLSFWVTAFFAHKYYIKLIVVVGLLVLGGVALLVTRIFQRVPRNNQVDGECVTEADAPLLWRRIRHMAKRLKTAPPDHIVAGIDTNFFVTEAPLTVAGKELKGRSLFVSIPLLRVLSVPEADAVLGHELAHFRGGDTRASAQLGPKLQQYDHYVQGMQEGGFTVVVYHFMQFYRMVFQIALSRNSREREFKADRAAAKLVSAQAISQSLVKIAAYDHYRSNTERALFERDHKLDNSLGIATAVAQGLRPYASSIDFVDDMRTAHIPHPFDSHPPLAQRMRQVGHPVDPDDYGAIVREVPATTWADEIATADAIEQRMWAIYEQQFAQNHEHALAYRYEPANDQERELVLKYFPPVVFKLKDGATVEVNYSGIAPSGDEPFVEWDSVKALQYNESSFGDSLTLTLHEKGVIGSKTLKVKLPGLGKQKDAFNEVVGQYWHRHQVMRRSH